MQMGLRLEHNQDVFLRIPTVWNEPDKQWIGFIKTPITQTLIHGQGKDSMELQNSFNEKMKEALENPKLQDEIFSMFKPLSEWK